MVTSILWERAGKTDHGHIFASKCLPDGAPILAEREVTDISNLLDGELETIGRDCLWLDVELLEFFPEHPIPAGQPRCVYHVKVATEEETTVFERNVGNSSKPLDKWKRHAGTWERIMKG